MFVIVGSSCIDVGIALLLVQREQSSWHSPSSDIRNTPNRIVGCHVRIFPLPIEYYG